MLVRRMTICALVLASGCVFSEQCTVSPKIGTDEGIPTPGLKVFLSKSIVGAGGEVSAVVDVGDVSNFDVSDLSLKVWCTNLGGNVFPASLRIPMRGEEQYFVRIAVPPYFSGEGKCTVEARIVPKYNNEKEANFVEGQFKIVAGAPYPSKNTDEILKQFPLKVQREMEVTEIGRSEVRRKVLNSALKNGERSIWNIASELRSRICDGVVSDELVIKRREDASISLEHLRKLMLALPDTESDSYSMHVNQFIGDLQNRLSELKIGQEVYGRYGEAHLEMVSFPQKSANNDDGSRLTAKPLLATLMDILHALQDVEESDSLMSTLRMDTCPEGAIIKYWINGFPQEMAFSNTVPPLRLTKARVFFDVTVLDKNTHRIDKHIEFNVNFFDNRATHVKVFCRPEVATEADVNWVE